MIWWLLSLILFQQAPARDSAGVPRSGTAVITGTVLLDDAEAKPLRRVTVTLSMGGNPAPPRMVLTDDAGRFVFTGIGPGSYSMQAARTGYVTAFYGSKRPGRGPGIPVAVTDGQTVSGVTLKMLRGAVITGVVRLPSGKPAAELTVVANLISTINGQRQLDTSSGQLRVGITNDRGEYRIFGLAPGDYLVQVSPPSSAGDLRRMTPADVAATQEILRGAGSSAAPLSPMGPSVGFASVFFPSTPDVGAADVIPLNPGQERGGVDLTLVFVPNARVSGTVVSGDGRPPQNLRLTLNSTRQSSDFLYFNNYLGVSTGRDGSFYSSGVMPGHYVLTARASAAGDLPPAGAGGGAGPIPGAPVGSPALTLWGSTEFDVNGQDVPNLVITLQPGVTVSGKFGFDSTVPPLPDLSRTQISLLPVTSPGAPSPGSTYVNLEKDGTFVVKGVAPGLYRVSMSIAGGRPPVRGVRSWGVKSVMMNGRDVADLPIQIRPGEDLADVAVTLTDQLTEVSGTVLDNLNRPTAGFPIVVFATDRAYWPAGDVRVKKVQPASDGKYVILGLPPGEYYVCAVTDAEASDLKDPAFLDSLAAQAFKITLQPGEKRPLDLKLGGRAPES